MGTIIYRRNKPKEIIAAEEYILFRIIDRIAKIIPGINSEKAKALNVLEKATWVRLLAYKVIAGAIAITII